MFADRILNFGKRFEGRLEPFLLKGALEYIDYNEEYLALEILCDHIAEYYVIISDNEYIEVTNLASDMGFNLDDVRFRHLKDLVA